MPQGAIKKLVEGKGFGFIDGEQGDIFFHYSALDGTAFEVVFEVLHESCASRVAALGVHFDGTVNDRGQVFGPADLSLMQHFAQQGGVRGPARQLSGDAMEEQGSQGEDVGPRVHGSTGGLLRGNVPQRADGTLR